MALPYAKNRTLRPATPGLSEQVCLWLALAVLVAFANDLRANARIDAAAPDLIEVGTPAFVIYGPESLGIDGAPSDLHVLQDGRLLVVGEQVLSIGDGTRWQPILRAAGEKDFIPQQIAVDDHDNLFVGVQDGFSQIRLDDSGRWYLHPAAAIPDSQHRHWARFQSASKVQGHWYWHSNSGAILQWDLAGSPRLVGVSNDTDCIFQFENRLLISDLSTGALWEASPEGLAPAKVELPPGVNNSIACVVPYDARNVLVGTNFKGLQLFDGHHLRPLVETGPLSGGLRISDLCQTYGGFYAAAVDTLGIVFFDRDGRILQILDRRLDHRLNRILRLRYSSDGTLWALLNQGLARIEFPSRISQFETMLDAGLHYIEPVRHKGRLWLQANGRILQALYSNDQRLAEFTENSPNTSYVYSISSFTGHLLATSAEGVFEYTANDEWRKVVADLPNARIVGKAPTGDRWIYVAEREYGFIDLSKRPYPLERVQAPALDLCYGAVQDQDHSIWLELGTGKVGRIRFDTTQAPRLEIYDHDNGVPEDWAAVCLIDGEMKLNAGNRLLHFDAKKASFEEDRALLQRYAELAQSGGRPFRDARGRFWISGTDFVSIISRPDGFGGSVERLPTDFRPFNFYDDDRGVVWMHEKRHFSRYDPDMPQPEPKPLQALITRIDLPNSSRSLSMPGETLPALPFSDNSLVAHFLAPGNHLGQHLSFEIMLEGLHDHWTPAGVTASALFTRLKEGHYVLRVRPVIGKLAGREARIAFKINPPWFRTRLAYTLYTLFGLLLACLAVLGPLYFERRQKARLERLIEERTTELNQANAQLARQMKESLRKAADLQSSEERLRRLSGELELRVEERTAELQRRVQEVERLNQDLSRSQRETEHAARRQRELNASLVVANHELESFSYSVSHDLRAPLRNITGFIELLQRKLHSKGDTDADRHLDIVSSEAKRMGALIDDLLTFSRIGRAEMKLSEVSLEALVSEVRRELAHEMEGRNIEWVLTPMPSVLGDPVLLRQVIANLLANAVKFTRKAAAARIQIGMTGAAQDDYLSFHVVDNGVGFNPKYMDKLFRVFQRLHSNREFEGTGIGLANVKRIIDRHGGQVWAEGTQGGGASFHFTLRRYVAGMEAGMGTDAPAHPSTPPFQT